MSIKERGTDHEECWTNSKEPRAIFHWVRIITSVAFGPILLSLALPASAAAPVRTITGTFTSFTIPGPCSANNVPFDVFVQALADKEAVTTFYNQQGVAIAQGLNGALAVRLTNKSTAKSIDLNISGSARIYPKTTEEIIMGPWLLFFTPGLPSNLELTDGRLEFLVDSSGNFTKLLSSVGTMQDVCYSLS